MTCEKMVTMGKVVKNHLTLALCVSTFPHILSPLHFETAEDVWGELIDVCNEF